MTAFNFLRDPLHPALETAMQFRLPPRWYPTAIAGALVALTTIAAGAVESYRLQSAELWLRRADVRFQNSRQSLSQERLQWNRVDRLVAEDRRLRALRLSGPVEASQIAAAGNALPDDAWLTTMTAGSGGMDVKGEAAGLAALQSALENVRADRRMGTAQRVRFSADRHVPGRMAFEWHLDPPQ